MDGRYDIMCIGTALMDAVIRGFDPEPVSAAGYRAAEGALFPGREAFNQAGAAARLGLRVGILCSLGLDGPGELILEELRRRGVDTALVLRRQEPSTPLTTIFVREDGSRRSITTRAHGYSFHPERCPEALNARALLLGSLFRAPFDEPEAVCALLRAARERGCLVFMDTKLPNLRPLRGEDMAEAYPLIDYITPNEDEAKFCTGRETPEEMADVFLSWGVKNVIIKLGPRGCLMKGAAGTLALPGHPVKAVDATGAGDCFAAGFAAELLRGAAPAEALRFANACGAICTAALGAGGALRDRDQVLRFLEKGVL